jgi:tetratricopeptide (TPR) repeat protein
MKNITFLLLLLVSLTTTAQKKDTALPEGNEKYKDQKYAEAEANYRISQSRTPTKATASYNLGNSVYRQNQASESKDFYIRAAKNAQSRAQKHYAFHNLGNAFMKEKKYQEAVEAYKNALRNNPADEETRYNYALAKEYLKNNPPKDDKKDKKDKKDKDKKEDEKEGDQKKKDQEKDGDQKGDKNQKPKEDAAPKPKPAGISKERVENLLDAVNNEEKKVQQKVNAQKVKGKPVKTEKDW